ncbi:Tripeptidyl-peptidase sed3 [Fulvia fulva]|uniref:tripeptidyl-peptidase II n=1 Tax=Passalora fulva TaxID=5499 RepID=A0A9Q8PFF7_PASFU|nr:Tripeptidyl-peptidase sed3 [Fulvia fulva]UJO21498.1 Tripeptidyl-peptidase sed3 [Fulvia fulva]
MAKSSSSLRALYIVCLALAGGVYGAPPTTPSGTPTRAPQRISPGFQRLGVSQQSIPYEFTMALKGAQLDQLDSRMVQIAQSGGEWLTTEELTQYTAPAPSSIADIRSLLTSHGIPEDAISFSKLQDFVTVQGTVDQVNKIFATQLVDWTRPTDGQTVRRAKEYTVPAAIAEHVIDVSPIAFFAPPPSTVHEPRQLDAISMENEKRAAPGSCNLQTVTPECRRDLYGLSSYTPKPVAGAIDISVLGLNGDAASQADLTTFLETYRSDASGYQLPIAAANGAQPDQNNPSAESNLDVQTTVSATYPLVNQFVSFRQSTADGFAEGMQYYIDLADSDRPGVVSISYAANEIDYSESQAQAMCAVAQKLTALGTTVVVGSGDNGVDTVQGYTALSCADSFFPTYPSGCPYILTTSATQDFSPEFAVNTTISRFWTGSGFSNLFPAPSYQSAYTSAYVDSLGSRSAGKYNKAGRGIPDVSAQGSNYPISFNGQFVVAGGTSAATPLMAAVLALINDARRAVGKGRVGYVHPTIYGSQGAFTDIISGAAFGCPAPDEDTGLYTSVGWDAVTGLGTPIFSGLRSLFGA